MNAPRLLVRARREAGLSLRALAASAGTSQPTLTAYEKGRVSPSVGTLGRILAAAGFVTTTRLDRRIRSGPTLELSRGEELVAVLDLAGQFPAKHDLDLVARHRSPWTLRAPMARPSLR